MLSKEAMIIRENSERDWVSKRPVRLQNGQGSRQQEEEEEVAPPMAAVSEGNSESDNGSDAVRTSTTTLSPPPMQTFVNNPDVDPLSAISDHDKDAVGFFETLCWNAVQRTSDS